MLNTSTSSTAQRTNNTTSQDFPTPEPNEPALGKTEINKSQQQEEQTNTNKNNKQTQNQQAQAQNPDQPYNLPTQKPEESQIAPGRYKPLPEENILKWKAPSRPFKKKNRKYFMTIFVIALLVALIFIFAGQGWLPAALTFSIVFLVYILSTIPPQEVENKITTYGIRIEDNLYYWEELGRFWFEEKNGGKVLYIETIRFPGRIALLILDNSKAVLKKLLSEVLLNQKPKPSPYEKVASWLQEKIPLDIES